MPAAHSDKVPALLQLRRARAWFPCVDTPDAACTWDMRYTVPMGSVAVSSGQLLKQVGSLQGQPTVLGLPLLLGHMQVHRVVCVIWLSCNKQTATRELPAGGDACVKFDGCSGNFLPSSIFMQAVL